MIDSLELRDRDAVVNFSGFMDSDLCVSMSMSVSMRLKFHPVDRQEFMRFVVGEYPSTHPDIRHTNIYSTRILGQIQSFNRRLCEAENRTIQFGKTNVDSRDRGRDRYKHRHRELATKQASK